MKNIITAVMFTAISSMSFAADYCHTASLDKKSLDFYVGMKPTAVIPALNDELIAKAEQVLEASTKLCDQQKADSARERKEFEAIQRRPGAQIGMTMKQVIEKTNWGKPDSINRTITSAGTREQWVYYGGYLYFTNGKLTAIQN